jgi:hypothetical protein
MRFFRPEVERVIRLMVIGVAVGALLQSGDDSCATLSRLGLDVAP